MSLSEQFQKLHSAKQFEEICVLYDSSSVEDDELALDWDYVYLMNGLYNQKRYSDGLSLYKRFVRKLLASGENRHYGSGDFRQSQSKQNSQSILRLRYT